MSKTTTYIVKDMPIRQGGKIIPPGRPIALTPEDALRLKQFLTVPDGDDFNLPLTSAVDQWEELRAQMQTAIDQLNSQLAERESELAGLTAEKELLAEDKAALELVITTLRQDNEKLLARAADLEETLANIPKTPAADPEAKGAAPKGGKK